MSQSNQTTLGFGLCSSEQAQLEAQMLGLEDIQAVASK